MDSLFKAPGTRFLLTGAALVVLLDGIRAAQELVVPAILAAFLAVLSAPAVLWLRKKRVPVAVGVPLVLLGMLAALTGVGALVGGAVTSFASNSAQYEARMDVLFGDAYTWLGSQGIELSRENITKMVDPKAAFTAVQNTVTGFANMLSVMLIVMLTVAFILFEVAELPDKIRAARGDQNADTTQLSKVASEVKQYVLIKTYVSLGTGLIIWIFLLALGVDYALLWALLAFLLNYVPNIGSVIAAVPPVLLALVQFGPARALIVLGGFVAVNMVVGNAIEPALMGRRLGLSSLVVFLSLIFWNWVLGPIGMLLSVPLTMIVKIMLENSGQWRWLAVMMSDRAPTPAEQASLSVPPSNKAE